MGPSESHPQVTARMPLPDGAGEVLADIREMLRTGVATQQRPHPQVTARMPLPDGAGEVLADIKEMLEKHGHKSS